MHIAQKLTILADAAKYDVSCASSGNRRSNRGGRLGNAIPSGVCHSYTADGRCVSLLKILHSNVCIYDCAYCVNRAGNDIPRATFTPNEIASLTIDFYRRNYIEGLFLSSGILLSPDDTMERLLRTVQTLRKQGFNGYIHLKCVPHASRRLIRKAGLYVDRLSINIELPSEKSLLQLTRKKTYPSILDPMGVIRDTIAQTREDRRRMPHTPAYSPAGQSTQLIIGASPESDYEILHLAHRLYRQQALQRVYYTAYIPLAHGRQHLSGVSEPPLKRENRLYQADWLIRLYGFTMEEVIHAETPYLDLTIDPKQAFAIRHPAYFPVDINTADREQILKVPGIGLKSANRIVSLRRKGRIRLEHLKQLGVVMSRAAPYIRCDGIAPGKWRGTTAPPASSKPNPSPSTHAHRVTSVRQTKRHFIFDGTFEGLLTAIFTAYVTKHPPDTVVPLGTLQLDLFEHHQILTTDPDKARRVWHGLKRHLGSHRRQTLMHAYLSETPGVETAIYRVVWDCIPRGKCRRDIADLTSHIKVKKSAHQVCREAHRMKGLVRFQQTDADRYIARIAPQYDVLPLIWRHFESRFADQKWIICDIRRNYGLCYDGRATHEIILPSDDLKHLNHPNNADESLCRALWQGYHTAVNIPQRNNPKLHLSQLPRRYWQYLPEKQS